MYNFNHIFYKHYITTSIVNIECIGAKQIIIVDAMGRAIYSKKKLNNQRSIINAQQFGKGVCVVQVTMQDGSIRNEKLVIE